MKIGRQKRGHFLKSLRSKNRAAFIFLEKKPYILYFSQIIVEQKTYPTVLISPLGRTQVVSKIFWQPIASKLSRQLKGRYYKAPLSKGHQYRTLLTTVRIENARVRVVLEAWRNFLLPILLRTSYLCRFDERNLPPKHKIGLCDTALLPIFSKKVKMER